MLKFLSLNKPSILLVLPLAKYFPSFHVKLWIFAFGKLKSGAHGRQGGIKLKTTESLPKATWWEAQRDEGDG